MEGNRYFVSKVKLKMVKEPEPIYCKNINTLDDMCEMLGQVFDDSDREKFVVVSFSAAMEPIAVEVVAIGSIDSCHVDVKSIFKHALLANATGIIVAHNHPSGNVNPSNDDARFTKRIVDCGELLDINVYDSIVYGSPGNRYSFMENNWELI